MKSKKFLYNLLSLFMLFSLVFLQKVKVQADELAAISYKTSSNNIQVGDEFDILVSIGNAINLSEVDMKFKYDPQQINILSVKKGELLNDFIEMEKEIVIDSTNGIVDYSLRLNDGQPAINVTEDSNMLIIHAKLLNSSSLKLVTTSNLQEFSMQNNCYIRLSDNSSTMISYAAEPFYINSNSSSTNINISLPENLQIDREYTVDINLNNVENIYGYSIDFIFDPKLIQLLDVFPSNFLPVADERVQELKNSYSNEVGSLVYYRMIVGTGEGISGSDKLLTIKFKVIGEGELKFNISRDGKENLTLLGNTLRVLMIDEAGTEIPFQGANVKATLSKDITAPEVFSAFPENGTQNVNTKPEIVLEYDESIQKGDNFSKITILDVKNNPRITNVYLTENGIRVMPKDDLLNYSSYRVLIPAGAIKDVYGNATLTDYILEFTTVKSVEDINGDGVVNILDMGQAVPKFGSISSDSSWSAECDVNADGVINGTDFTSMAEKLKVEQAIRCTAIGDIAQRVIQGSKYVFPETVSASLDDGTTKSVSVKWNNPSLDTMKTGTFTFEGVVEGYISTVKLIINVQGVLENQEVLSKAANPNEWIVYGGKVESFESGIKITRDSSDTGSYTEAYLNLPYDITGKMFVFKIKKLDSNLERIGLQFKFGDPSMGKRFEGCLWSNYIPEGTITIPVQVQGLAPAAGALVADFGSFNTIGIEVIPIDITKPVAISIEEIRIIDNIAKPGIAVLTFDDGDLSLYSEAFSAMKKYNFPGCAYVETGNVGNQGKVDLAQLKEIYNNGWDVASHTISGGQLDGDLSSIQKELLDSQKWLKFNGFERGMKHISYPGGYMDDTVLEETKKLYISGRKVGGVTAADGFGLSGWPQINNYEINNLYCTSTMEAGTENKVIDSLSEAGGVCVFTFHDIQEETTTKIEDWSKTRFENFIEYLHQKNIRVMTLSQLLEGINTGE